MTREKFVLQVIRDWFNQFYGQDDTWKKYDLGELATRIDILLESAECPACFGAGVMGGDDLWDCRICDGTGFDNEFLPASVSTSIYRDKNVKE